MSFFKINKLDFPWKKYEFKLNNDKVILFLSGWLTSTDFEKLLKIIKSKKKNIKTELISWLRNQNGHFGLILTKGTNIYLATDKIASFNIFYCNFKKSCIVISSYSSDFIDQNFNDDIDKFSSNIYQLSGYTLGNKTIRSSVKKILPGELCVIKKIKEKVLFSHNRYFLFYPKFKNKKNEKYYEKKLEKTINLTIKRLIEQANGRTIVLSLSAGLDSRLILTKLLEFNYKNIHCFSYGLKNNFEAKEAELIAKKLNVKWTFIEDDRSYLKRASLKKGFLKNYFFKYSGLHTTAAMTEILYLKKLVKKYPMLQKGIFTNGQSGDFITGGHIPNKNISKLDQYLELFAKKHFSLIENISHSPRDLIKLYKLWIKSSYINFKFDDLYSLWQLMEWQERQSFYVVHQVKAYDYLGLEWSMPLWDGELMSFYQDVPLKFQIDQKLYVNYLKNWNYKGLFVPLRVNPKPWTRFNLSIIFIAKVIQLTLGNKKRKKFYKILDYYSTNNYQYNHFTFQTYLKNFEKIRNPVTLFTNQNYDNLKKQASKMPNSIL